ncbi:MAG: type I-E CRISPR-associated protein Cas7/Cse4/CasC [Candidatus Lambdaproteobacteria bacterium RIFOXYD1_FULL_56_27]|uniref:Type I-E CRISPR-associated protein Cas7/Cse4/CasC n=1 Tax=Candidatus Lambdaproteobacteria bacterium RIFOXYD2_FULL_56_26 TaxID=1817773 RepID=A0A1F6GL06_9PROT|nr:MAG: type I-E CRISPR-associated protein Cas7/Cse4/CasC [Candidatus Lambdaproteobacteria bacterium RIFOXYD2_FULL_56_26]OGH04203.1 MAG: type I-E CRISPR-associated protein Cas7/Cse4/CasC [Candidatus Lambdaproteobacteria bacterium RIFOXYC1_FULL_56_13]OGH08845.1 MAG: type I-E CRISPR-associated protein Cas7/Cse4/CasC [Candidatus Lambdaproteobacteria bacterium RIFOXYD1_FULL_56_27]
MSKFIQLHLLTSYPPSNLNRDDLGKPKSAVIGGAPRLRISSQSLKRAWRTSELFSEAMAGHIGTRTKRMGGTAYDLMVEKGLDPKVAKEAAQKIAAVFGKLEAEKDKDPHKATALSQLAHFSPAEEEGIRELSLKVAASGTLPEPSDLELLRKDHKAVDVAMFGRMFAEQPGFNMEAATQVAHAVTVHQVKIEDDFFTAVDDLNRGDEDAGAAHLGEVEFAAGIFYLYLCINETLLVENLGGDKALAKKAVQALAEAVTQVSPTGKINSFAHHSLALYVLAEVGTCQPRNLSLAYLSPAEPKLDKAIQALEETKAKLDQAYNQKFLGQYTFNPLNPADPKAGPKGNLKGLTDFLGEDHA